MEYPKLRPVEAIPAQNNLTCLRDPQGFSDKLLFLPQPVLFIVSLFDGRHSLLDIQAEYTRRFGDLLFSDKVREIVEQLDGALFLDSDRFRQAKRDAIEAFRAARLRKAVHAGESYGAEAGALGSELESLFTAAGGPGLPRTGSPSGRLRALIAPHIDLRRGGACFAAGYAELARECRARTFVILGIAHAETSRLFVLTGKDFETPLGNVPTDREFLDSLAGRCSTDFYQDEFAHRGEHSVEFQALFLRYLYRDDEALRIVPMLCSLRPGAYGEGSPRDNAEVEEFLAALQAALAERGSEACCIAAVDLSHLGRRFGQDLTMTPAFLQQVEKDDRSMIATILEGKAEEFFQGILAEQDRRNVCGVPAIYALLRVQDGSTSRLLRYEQAVDRGTESVVSFMAAAFYAGGPGG